MATLEQTIDVNVPLHAAYSQWMRFEDYPRFMEGVVEVLKTDDAHLHWRAQRHQHEVEWDSEIVREIPDQLISWRDMHGQHRGSLGFEPLSPQQTRVRMHMEFDAMPVDKEQALTQRIAQDLARFKRMMETHEQQAQAMHIEAGTSADASASSVGKSVGQTEAERAEAAQSQSAAAASADAQGEAGAAGNETRGEARGAAQAWLRNQFASWEDPMALVRKMTDEMDQLFDRYIGRPIAARFGEGGVAGKWMPPVEIAQRDDRLVLCIDLPGIPRQDVHLLVQRDKITVEGERREQPRPPDMPGFKRSERSYGPFHRTIPLPEGVNADTARASMRDGVLEISFAMPDPVQAGGRRIDIGD
jgi:HSP20 family molecular chaperone IbpA